MLKVNLISHTPDPERVVAAAAKMCYSKSGPDDIMNNLTPENTEKFLNRLISMGHESPIEHISFTFGVEGVSRSLLAQLTRHRIASYSVKSQRYVEEDNFNYVVPPEIEKNERAMAIYKETMDNILKSYNELTEILYDSHKTETDEKAARKKAIEDARFVLPNACETKLVMTFNARSLLNFFSERCCERAQWEIRELANRMLKIVKEIAPVIFKNAGPKCVRGACPEGPMSCGKRPQMIEKYKKSTLTNIDQDT